MAPKAEEYGKMTTIKIKNFDDGEVAVCRSKHVGGAVFVTLARVVPGNSFYRATCAKISPEEARSIAKALLTSAHEAPTGA